MTFQDLLAMKLANQQEKLDVLRSLSREEIVRLNNEGVEHLERLQARMGAHRQLYLVVDNTGGLAFSTDLLTS